MEGLTSSIPFGLLLAILFLVVYWMHVFFLVYHLVRFGVGTAPKQVAIIFFMGAVVLFGAVLVTYARLDLAVILNDFNTIGIPGLPKP